MFIERRQEEESLAPAIYHKVADIPNGVTLKVTGFEVGTVIPEATPVYPDSNGLYATLATAKVIEAAGATATDYSVAKGHLFKVGDKIVKDASTNVTITTINTTDAAKDVITVDATLTAKAANAVLTQGGTTAPIAVTGEVRIVEKLSQNVTASAWVMAVVNKNLVNVPSVKPSGVHFV